MFAMKTDFGDIAEHLESSPIETVEEAQKQAEINTASLPHVLQVLVGEDREAQLRMILTLHKRLHHRKAPELRAILNQSGIPNRVLNMVEDALAMCVECKRWQVPHSNPASKAMISSCFNRLVYADLVFLGDP